METLKIMTGCLLLFIGIKSSLILITILGLVAILSAANNLTWRLVRFLEQTLPADQAR